MTKSGIPIPSGWKVLSLPEIVDFQEGPGILAKDFETEGVPLIRLEGLTSDSLLNGCNYLNSNLVEKRWKHFKLAQGDILLSTSASLGRVCAVNEEAVGSIPYTGIIRFRPKSGLSIHYLKYFFKSPIFQQQVEAMGVGSVIKHFGPTHLKQMSILLPPAREQEEIAGILSSLDERIELNHRINTTLEKLARTLFKKWFIDIDKKLLEKSRIAPLDEIANFINGLALQNYPPENEKDYLPVIKIRELNNGIDERTDKTSKKIPKEYILNDGDVLFSWSGSLNVIIWGNGPGALNQHLFKVTSQQYPKWFYYQWTKHFLPKFKKIASDKAVTMGHIKRSHLTESKVLIPNNIILSRMNEAMSPIMEAIINNLVETRGLINIHSSLLPRLINGKIRVRL